MSTTGEAQEVWHNQPNDRVVNIAEQSAPGRRLRRLPANVGGAAGVAAAAAQPRQQPPSPTPVDEWDRYYSLDV